MVELIKTKKDFPYIQSLQKQSSLKDDPVRPKIPFSWRTKNNNKIYTNGGAILCAAFLDNIPSSEEQMLDLEEGNIAVFYTIWSYMPKAGTDLLLEVYDMLKPDNSVRALVTLSPKTKVAYNFHIKNGARLLRENENSYNFEYLK